MMSKISETDRQKTSLHDKYRCTFMQGTNSPVKSYVVDPELQLEPTLACVLYSKQLYNASFTELNICGGWEQISDQSRGPQGGQRGEHRQAEEEHVEHHDDPQQRSGRQQRRDVEVLHGRLSGNQSGPRTCPGDVSAVHRVRVHAAHLGQVHPQHLMEHRRSVVLIIIPGLYLSLQNRYSHLNMMVVG